MAEWVVRAQKEDEYGKPLPEMIVYFKDEEFKGKTLRVVYDVRDGVHYLDRIICNPNCWDYDETRLITEYLMERMKISERFASNLAYKWMSAARHQDWLDRSKYGKDTDLEEYMKVVAEPMPGEEEAKRESEAEHEIRVKMNMKELLERAGLASHEAEILLKRHEERINAEEEEDLLEQNDKD